MNPLLIETIQATRTRPGPQGPSQNGPPPPGPQGPPGHFGQQPFPPNNYYGPPGAWGRGGPMPGPGPGGFGNMPYPPPPGWFPPGQGFPPGPGGPGPPWGNQSFPPGPVPPGGLETQNHRGPPGTGPQDAKPAPIGPGADRSKTGTPSQPAPSAESKARLPSTSATAETPAPTPPVESKPSTAEVKAVAANLAEESSKPSEAAKPPPSGSRSHRVNPVIPLSGAPNRFQPPVSRDQTNTTSVQTTVTTTPGSVQDATSAARAAVAVAMAQLGNNPGGNAMDNLTNKVNEMRVNAVRGGPTTRARGRGGRPQAKMDVPDSDFDFAQSNAKFNKEDIVKEAIAGPPLAEAPNGTTSPAIPEAPASSDIPVAYNKSRSFFDNISSEARERAENQGQRAGGREWRDEEQRRNMETFGQGSVDGGHRNQRGRGRGRGRGTRGRGFTRGGRGGNRPQFQTSMAEQ